jgi:hypothetical protein
MTDPKHGTGYDPSANGQRTAGSRRVVAFRFWLALTFVACALTLVTDAYIAPVVMPIICGPQSRGVPRLARVLPCLKAEARSEAGNLEFILVDAAHDQWGWNTDFTPAVGEYVALMELTRDSLKKLDLSTIPDHLGSGRPASERISELEEHLSELAQSGIANARTLDEVIQEWMAPIIQELKRNGFEVDIHEVTDPPPEPPYFGLNPEPQVARNYLFFDFSGQTAASDELVRKAGTELKAFLGATVELRSVSNWSDADGILSVSIEELSSAEKSKLVSAIVKACQTSRRSLFMFALAWSDVNSADRKLTDSDWKLIKEDPAKAMQADSALVRFLAGQYQAHQITRACADADFFKHADMGGVHSTMVKYAEHMELRMETAASWVGQSQQAHELLHKSAGAAAGPSVTSVP